MKRKLYSPQLADDVIRRLYHEGKRRGIPMTRLANELLRPALAHVQLPALQLLPDPVQSNQTAA